MRQTPYQFFLEHAGYIYTPDVKSGVTGHGKHHGKHNRLIVFGSPDGRGVTVREDIRPGLAMSTEN